MGKRHSRNYTEKDMSSREDILKSIREHTQEHYAMPQECEHSLITYENKQEQFISILKQVGGEAIAPIGETGINQLIKELYPNAKRIASVLPEITIATFNPDEVADAAALNGTDVAVIRGKLGVAENGAVWIEQDIKYRALYFISENLVILLDKEKLVNNMEEAYRLINTGPYGYGTFISGPSKTADIEQALVFGAHGAKGVTVILTGS